MNTVIDYEKSHTHALFDIVGYSTKLGWFVDLIISLRRSRFSKFDIPAEGGIEIKAHAKLKLLIRSEA